MNPSLRRLFALLFIAAAALPASGADLRILVTGIESDRGLIHCALFGRDKGFPERDGGVVQVQRYPAAPPMLTCTFPKVEPGRYAVAVSHDEDGDEEVDSDFENGSEEPWGVTNNARPGNRAPRFSEAAIYLSEGQPYDYEVALGR